MSAAGVTGFGVEAVGLAPPYVVGLDMPHLKASALEQLRDLSKHHHNDSTLHKCEKKQTLSKPSIEAKALWTGLMLPEDRISTVDTRWVRA